MYDQSRKKDNGKARLTLVPRKIFTAIAKVREFGISKYKDPDNWKNVEIERYRDALFRHWLAYLDNPEGKDEESGLPILWHVACNCAFLCELEDCDMSTMHDHEEAPLEVRSGPSIASHPLPQFSGVHNVTLPYMTRPYITNTKGDPGDETT